MIEEYKTKIEQNNVIIEDLKQSIYEHFKKSSPSNDYSFDTNASLDELKEIYNNQLEEINHLHIIIDVEYENTKYNNIKMVEKLKEKETDKIFSEYYRNGFVEINGVDVSVDKFYMKELEDENHKQIFNFICADKRIDNKIFGSIEDKDYFVKNIYPLKKSKIFYEMYLNSNLFINNKITINNEQQLNLFMKYIHEWTPEKHKMVAETMFN